MPSGKYKNVTLPEGLVEQVDKLIEEDETYTSRAEFIKEAIREHLDKKRRYKEGKTFEGSYKPNKNKEK